MNWFSTKSSDNESVPSLIKSHLKPYFAIAGCFLLLIIALKVAEVLLLGTEIQNSFQLLVNALVYNCVVVSWVILAGGIVFWLFSLLSSLLVRGTNSRTAHKSPTRKPLVIVTALLYALFLVSEAGLTLYSMHNGYLLDSELFARPLSESLTAIRGTMGVVKPILLTIVIMGGFIALALWRVRSVKRKTGTIILLAFAVLMFMLSVFFKTSHLLTFGVNNRFVYNKCYFLIDDSIYYLKYWNNESQNADNSLKLEELKMSEEELDMIVNTHPEWGVPLNPEYPLERAFVADTFLNRYFESQNQKPNIVIIIVESMGHEYMDWGAMPFVDSLASTGLYWPNCLSTTIRSYGAIPAITGSVGGPKTFQFGTMPDHNSLLSLLKKEGYNTRAYYGGEFTFDCIYEYFTTQHIDYMSPFYDTYRATPEGKHGFWWGATDDYLFQNTIDDLNNNVAPNNNSPHLSVITTLSMHEELKLYDKKRQDSYMQRVEKLRSVCDAEHKKLEGVSSALFTDDIIREFIKKYSKRADFENTIFVVTGDHASGRQNGDMLSYHHVPLIIWSPLVKTPTKFSHIVTHNDITPALYSLLTSKYGVSSQPTIHWLGDGLGPSPKTLVIVNYMHVITDIIYHNIYYHYDTRFPPEEVYTFDSGMKLKPCSNTAIRDTGRTQLELMTKLLFYTYHANRLTAHPVYKNDFEQMDSYQLASDIVCSYPNKPPSIVGEKKYDILRSTQIRPVKGYSTIRINIEADIKVNKDIDLTKYPDIRFSFDGNMKLRETDKLSKFFDSNKDVSTETNHLSLSKDYPIGDTPAIVGIELATPMYDDDYVEGVVITFSNVKINVLYGK